VSDDPTNYKPGDEVNGYILGTDGKWHAEHAAFSEPVSQTGAAFKLVEPASKKSPIVTIVAIVAGLVALLVVVGAAMSMSDSSDEPVTRPTPVVEAPSTPEPEPTPTEDTSEYQGDYAAVTGILEAAWSGTDEGTDPCLAWYVDRKKWTNKFASLAVEQLSVEYSTAADATEDFFDNLCGDA